MNPTVKLQENHTKSKLFGGKKGTLRRTERSSLQLVVQIKKR